jgi:hypothetical protein
MVGKIEHRMDSKFRAGKANKKPRRRLNTDQPHKDYKLQQKYFLARNCTWTKQCVEKICIFPKIFNLCITKTDIANCSCPIAVANDGCSCYPGYGYVAALSSCVACGPTEYQPSVGLTSCLSCPLGASISGSILHVDASQCQCPPYSLPDY